jgi:hypothetical protein
MYADAVGDRRARGLPEADRIGVAADLEADLLEQQIGVALDLVEAFRRQQLVRRDLAGDERRCGRLSRARFLTRLAPARAGASSAG